VVADQVLITVFFAFSSTRWYNRAPHDLSSPHQSRVIVRMWQPTRSFVLAVSIAAACHGGRAFATVSEAATQPTSDVASAVFACAAAFGASARASTLSLAPHARGSESTRVLTAAKRLRSTPQVNIANAAAALATDGPSIRSPHAERMGCCARAVLHHDQAGWRAPCAGGAHHRALRGQGLQTGRHQGVALQSLCRPSQMHTVMLPGHSPWLNRYSLPNTESNSNACS